jgi:hypothetical protein
LETPHGSFPQQPANPLTPPGRQSFTIMQIVRMFQQQ